MNALWTRLRAWWLLVRHRLRRHGGKRLPAPEPASERIQIERELPGPPRACATVVIPALNESARIAGVVAYAWSDPCTAEVIVIDDSSIDDTADLARSAGARVVTSSMLGKGASMRDGAEAAGHEIVLYLDGDLAGLRPGIVTDLCRPLFHDRADFVKASFVRAGGRVTELTAKPMLKVFFPELSHLTQPLGGIVSARRSLLRALTFEDGYGVDIALVIDAHRAGARLAEVDIGALEHDSQPLHDLARMANEVSRVIYARALATGRLHIGQITTMFEMQRQAAASIDYVLTRRQGRTRLLLLDMDGTITPERFVVQLARATQIEDALSALLEGPSDEVAARGQKIAALFRFVHRQQFERVAQAMPLRPGVIEWVNQMRRADFMVGVISEGWFVAAEILRKRVFADFALAHTLQFDGEVCSGGAHLNPAFLPSKRVKDAVPCKGHVVRRFREDPAEPRVAEVWAVGNDADDLGMLRQADRAFVIDPKAGHLARAARATVIPSFDAMLAAVPAAGPTAPV